SPSRAIAQTSGGTIDRAIGITSRFIAAKPPSLQSVSWVRPGSRRRSNWTRRSSSTVIDGLQQTSHFSRGRSTWSRRGVSSCPSRYNRKVGASGCDEDASAIVPTPTQGLVSNRRLSSSFVARIVRPTDRPGRGEFSTLYKRRAERRLDPFSISSDQV